MLIKSRLWFALPSNVVMGAGQALAYVQQQNFDMLFDVHNKKLSFASTHCDRM
jgi:hypothetical protein